MDSNFPGLFYSETAATNTPEFVHRYDAGPWHMNETVWSIHALYLSYPEGTFSFNFEYFTVAPNATSTWVDCGADIANVWSAVREDIVNLWIQNTTFQWTWYDVYKRVEGVSKLASQLGIQIQTPYFVKGCDTSCGGHCNPNECPC